MSPVDPSLLDRDIAVIKQRHGIDAIHLGSEQVPVEKFPIDSPAVMWITGGGIPIGRVTRLYGDPSTGKSFLAWLIIKAAQQYRSPRFPNGLTCCYWNVEGQYDPVFVAALGVDTSKLMVMEHRIIEDIAGSMDLLLASAHLHVIDSASFATPLEEIVGKDKSKHPEYQVQVGAHSRAWKRAINRIHTRMDKDENVIVVIDHVGRSIDTQIETPLSGRRMEFRSDLSIHLRKGAWLYYDKNGRLETKDKVTEEKGISPEGQKAADGQEISIMVAKSRVCRPLMRAKMRLDLNQMLFDQAFEYANFAIFYDEDGNLAHRSKKPTIIAKTSNGFYKPPGYEKALHGMHALCQCINGDPILQANIMHAMLKQAK